MRKRRTVVLNSVVFPEKRVVRLTLTLWKCYDQYEIQLTLNVGFVGAKVFHWKQSLTTSAVLGHGAVSKLLSLR